MKRSTVSDRLPYIPRKFVLSDEATRANAIKVISNAPIDTLRPLEVLVREQAKKRKPDQNAAMWAGPLKDIQEQGYVKGRTYSAEVWHEHFKREHLPEDFDPELCREGYIKWDYTPKGERVLVGSTTMLTIRGMAQYMTKVEADGAGLGVKFHVNPRQEPA